MDNRHNQSIPADTLAQVLAKITEAAELMAPYKVALTPAERLELPKMGEKTVSFVGKSQELMATHSQLVPAYLDKEAFDIDFGDAIAVHPVRIAAEELYRTLDDFELLSGSEAYQGALLFYNAVQVAAKKNVGGASVVYEDLRQRFPTTARRKKTTAPETGAAQ